VAIHIGAMDVPNKRKVHTEPMPRLGGLAIYLSFLICYMLFGQMSTQMLSIIIASFVIILFGIVDDINPLKARYKLVGQLITACIIVFYGKIILQDIYLFNYYINFGSLAPYITVLFIISCINAINLIDGLDGLAAGISTIYFITIAIIAFLTNRIGGLDIILSIIMSGATLGFLVYNFPPAKIFMGDTGSQFLGFIISIICLLGFKNVTFNSMVVPITILAIPIFDTLFAILRRLLKGESIGTPDKEHFHHQLLKMKFSTRKTVLIIYLIDIAFALVSIFLTIGDTKIATYLYVLLTILLLFVVLKTDILFEHKKTSKRK
jgi:UDP-GlcNAc:undecaprenyl-phosphate GlcNAc-1-phosphate transferase